MTKITPMRQNERLRSPYVAKKGCLHGSFSTVESTVKYDKNGYAHKCSETIEFDPVKHFASFNAADFSLENIIAAGALGLLKEGYVSKSNLEYAEDGERNVSAIDAAIADEINNNEVKNED